MSSLKKFNIMILTIRFDFTIQFDFKIVNDFNGFKIVKIAQKGDYKDFYHFNDLKFIKRFSDLKIVKIVINP